MVVKKTIVITKGKAKGGSRRVRTGKRQFHGKKAAATTVVRGPTIFSDNYVCKMNLNHFFTFDQNAEAVPFYSIKANSIFAALQPDSARQPLGYNELALIYDKWLVKGCKVDIKWVSTTNSPSECYTNWSTTAAVANQPLDVIRERNYTQQRLITAASGGGGSIKRAKTYMSTKKFFGLKTLGRANEGYVGDDTGDVLAAQRYFMNFYTASLTSALTTVVAEIKITYYVTWFDRRPLTGSTT